MKEYDFVVNGHKLHARKETAGRVVVTVPREFLYDNQMTPQEYEEFLPTSCAHGCPPQNCPERVEKWIYARDPEKMPRDLTFLKARLRAQCAKNHPQLNDEDVRIVTQLKRRKGRCPVKKK